MESETQKYLPLQVNFARIIYVFHQHFRYEVCEMTVSVRTMSTEERPLLPHICNVPDVRTHECDLIRVSHEDIVILACWRLWWRVPHNATKRPSAVPWSMGSMYSVRSRWRRISPVPSAATDWQLTAARRSSALSTGKAALQPSIRR